VHVLAKYCLSVISRETERPMWSGKTLPSSSISYLPDVPKILFAALYCLVFLVFLIQQASGSVCCAYIPTPAIYPVHRVVLDSTVFGIWNFTWI